MAWLSVTDAFCQSGVAVPLAKASALMDMTHYATTEDNRFGLEHSCGWGIIQLSEFLNEWLMLWY